MNCPAEQPGGRPSTPQRFVTTQWRMVLMAAQNGESRQAALENLCRTYWYPLYAYIRRRGYDPDNAKDLTQEFFARLLSKNWLAKVAPEAGRFRSFLLMAVNRFLANEYDRSSAQKRGGQCQILPLDVDTAEAQYGRDLGTAESPETIFERRWALAVLDQALGRLRQEMTEAGKTRQFEVLNPFLSREPQPHEYEAATAALGVTRGALAVTVHRLRHRCRELVRDEIAATLVDPTQVDEEMKHLMAVLRG